MARRRDGDLGVLGDGPRDVDRFEAPGGEQLVEVCGTELDVVLRGELARALGSARPHGDRFELVELDVRGQRDLRAVATADDGDLDGGGHARRQDTRVECTRR